MTYWEKVHQEEKDGLIITLEITQETDAPDWDFESEQERQDLIEQINNGNILWFVAKVSAMKQGIVLADDYLGGCCYDSIKDFINDGYYQDMVDNVITEAKQKIIDLTY